MSVIIFAESSEGKFKKAVFEAVSFGKKISDKLGLQAIAVCISDTLPSDADLAALGKFGASRVIKVKSSGSQPAVTGAALAEISRAENASVVVISNNYAGKSIAPVLAVKLGASILSGVISVPDTNGTFSVRKTVFSGKAYADVELTGKTNVLAITPNSFSIEETGTDAPVEERAPGISEDGRIRTVSVEKIQGKIPLTEAELVVSGGRGMKGPENWGLIEELAAGIGAATACSKPVADMHWRPHEEHVGQTGITIKPNLYIAIGISGAIQHLAGVSSSKVIVAINKDPEAPFFKAADYGIVGDAFDVLPKLVEAAKQLKASQ
jgi:electron transfer flavoprotein alpha subunit